MKKKFSKNFNWIMFFMISILVIQSCRKTEFISSSYKERSEKFFTTDKKLNEAKQVIYDKLKLQDEKAHFVAKLKNDIGYPIWNKLRVKKEINANAKSTTTDSSEIVYIPLSNDNEYLSGVLVAEKLSDSSYSIIPLSDSYVYKICHEANIDLDKTEKTLALFLYMDSYTFEKTDYENIPAILFTQYVGYDTSDGKKKIKIKAIDPDSRLSNISYYSETCLLWATPGSCTCAGGSGNCLDWQDGCSDCSDTYCWSWHDGDGNNPGGGGSSGTGGDGNSGGGSGDDGSTPTNPCGGTWYRNDGCPGNGGGSNGNNSTNVLTWFNASPDFNVDITSDDLGPCANGIVSALFGQQNTVIKTIKDLFSESTKFNLKFSLDASIPSIAKAEPSPNYVTKNSVYGKFTKLDVEIKINPSFLTQSTKLAIAESIIHELIHAYFFYRQTDANGDIVKTRQLATDLGFLKPFDPNANPSVYGSGAQHEQMAANYITEIANALKEYRLITDADLAAIKSVFPTITVNEFYEAMAWGGLTTAPNGVAITKAWETFSSNNPQKASNYQVVISAEENGTNLAPSQLKCQ